MLKLHALVKLIQRDDRILQRFSVRHALISLWAQPHYHLYFIHCLGQVHALAHILLYLLSSHYLSGDSLLQDSALEQNQAHLR